MTGFLCLDKRAGKSSFQTVAEIRRICGEKKLGHTGTLDPMATGVLPVAFGRASKFIELLPDRNKAYTARIRLGTRTDTLDCTGKVLETRPVTCGEEELCACLPDFLGEIEQIPPMYSALSVGGVRLYEMARAGQEIARKPRRVRIDEIRFLGAVGPDEYELHVACGAGTYIRTLADDLGQKLGCGAMLTALRRTFSNGFSIEHAVTAQDVADAAERGEAESLLVPVERAMDVYPAVTASEGQTKRLLNGSILSAERLTLPSQGGLCRVYDPAQRFLGVGAADETGYFRMKKLYIV